MDAHYPVMEASVKAKKLIDAVRQEVSEGRVSKSFSSIDELFADLTK